MAKSLIPILTSQNEFNNGKNGFTFSPYTVMEDYYKAFDGNTSTALRSAINPSFPAYVTVNFPTAYDISRYSLSILQSSYQIKSYDFQVLMDGTWQTVHSVNRTSQSLEEIVYTFRSIRVNAVRIKVNSRFGDNSFSFTEFKVFESSELVLLKKDNKIYSVKEEYYDFDTETFTPLENADFINGGFFLSSLYKEGELKVKETIDVLPTMTSNTTPSPYVVTSSSKFSTSYEPWNVFSKTNTGEKDSWISESGKTSGWIQIDLNVPTKVNKMKLVARNYSDSSSMSPNTFSLQGSNDGVTFTPIQQFTGQTGWSSNSSKEYTLNNTVEYRYYRLDITSNNGGNYITLGNLYLYNVIYQPRLPRPIDVFDNFKIISQVTGRVVVNALKSKKELVIASGDIVISKADHIDYMKLDVAKSTNSDIRIAFSTDEGLNWFTSSDGIIFTNLDCIIPLKDYSDMSVSEKAQYEIAKNTIAEHGMTSEIFNTVDFNTLTAYKVRFAYVLSKPTYADVCNVKQLDWKFNAKGYMKELKDTEYDLAVFNHSIQTKSLINSDIVKVTVIT